MDVLRDPSFAASVCLLAIDEIHLVSEWRAFRPEYWALGVLRTRLPDGIPFLGVSATLDAKTLQSVREQCGFHDQTVIIKTSLDRPEIFIQASCLKYPATGMLDLQHLLPAQASKPTDVPKTIVYMDSLTEITKAHRLMKEWMKLRGYPPESAKWVSPYFADMASGDKERLQIQFRATSQDCQNPRILIASEAYGLGVDNPDVSRVVQWLTPTSTSRMYQRMGRAMRIGNQQAWFTLLYAPWCVGPCSGPAQLESAIDIPKGQVRPHKSRPSRDADRRRDMPHTLYSMINAGLGVCLRDIGLRFFDDATYISPGALKPDPCCSACHPLCSSSTNIDIQSADILSKPLRPNQARVSWFKYKLKDWRVGKAQLLFKETLLEFIPSLVMPDEILDEVAKYGGYIKDVEMLARFTDGAWTEAARYGDEVVAILLQGQAMGLTDEEIDREHRKAIDIKKGRLEPDHINPAVKEFEQQRENWMIGLGFKPDKGVRKEGALVIESNSPDLRQQITSPVTPVRQPRQLSPRTAVHDLDEGTGLTTNNHSSFTEQGLGYATAVPGSDSAMELPSGNKANTQHQSSPGGTPRKQQGPRQRPQRTPEAVSSPHDRASRELPSSRSGRKRYKPAGPPGHLC